MECCNRCGAVVPNGELDSDSGICWECLEQEAYEDSVQDEVSS